MDTLKGEQGKEVCFNTWMVKEKEKEILPKVTSKTTASPKFSPNN